MDIRYVVVLTLLSLGVTCPVYQCADINRGVCAEVEDGVVTVNSIGCPSNQHCYLSHLQEGGLLATKTTLLCAELPQSRGFVFGQDDQQCQHKDPLARLAEGAHPKRCNGGQEDPACLLANGNYAACDCGLDSQRYCRFSSGDSEFDYYYEVCDSYDGSPSRATLEFWNTYRVYGHIAASAPACMVKTVYELSLLETQDPNYAAWTALGVAVLAVLN